jgi:uncharacterized membrane protein YdjX (TVP38/TMEM64 family)
MTKQKQKRDITTYVKIGLTVFFGGALVLFFLLGGHKYMSFEAIKESRETLIDYKDRHFALVFAASLLIYPASTAFSLPIASILSLLAGLLFGRWLGTAVIVIGGALGAALLLVAARYVFTDFFKRWKRAAGHMHMFDQGFCRHGFLYVAFLRVVPILPFWLVNLMSAFTRIRLSTYVAGTIAGMLPISFVWAQMGEKLESIDTPGDAVSGPMMISLTVIGVLGIAGIIGKEYFLAGKGKRRHAAARS